MTQSDCNRGSCLHGEGACCTRLVDLGVRLGGRIVLENINLHVHCGELTAIIGPNGAGKTTLLRAVIGEIAHSGQLLFQPVNGPAKRKRPRIGYVPQRIEIDKTAPFTVLDLFAAAGTRWPLWLWCPGRIREEAAEALECVGAAHLLESCLGNLSSGQLQRVLLALALKPAPELLLLDEPLTGLDRTGMVQFHEIVSGLRKIMDLSIMMVSHDLHAAAAIADRMVFINNRTVLWEGTPDYVLRQPDVRETFGFHDPVHGAGTTTGTSPGPVESGEKP